MLQIRKKKSTVKVGTVVSTCRLLRDLKCRVNFDGDGGTLSYSTKDYVVGKAYGEFPTAAKEGYAFEKWVDEAGDEVKTTDKASKNLELTAEWFDNTDYLTVQTTAENDAQFYISKVGSPADITIEYRTIDSSGNASGWSTMQYGVDNAVTFNNKLQLRGDNDAISTAESTWYNFKLTGQPVKLSGQVMSILSKTLADKTLPHHCFWGLFYQDSTIVDASGLTLPKSSSQAVFKAMFRECTSMQYAPEFPDCELGVNACAMMYMSCTALLAAPAVNCTAIQETMLFQTFSGCTSLKSWEGTPNATSVGKQGCYQMFYKCSSLTTRPALPATNFTSTHCYYGMFQGCTSLATAPKLPATTLTSQCYNYMFYGCTSLSSIEVSFAAWGNNTSYNWVYNVASSGTFICPDSLPDTRGVHYIPANWTKTYIVEGTLYSNNALLNTGYTPTTSTKVEVKMKPVSTTPDAYVGFLYTGDNNDFRLFYTNGKFYYDYGNRRIQTSMSFPSSAWSTFIMENGKLTINGTEYTGTANTNSTPSTIYIFGQIGDGHTTLADMYIDYMKIYEGDELAMDLICTKDSDGVPCMYDKVSGEYLRSINENTPTFTAKES